MSAAPSAEANPGGHAGLMDRVYRRQRHLYDFTRKYYLFGRDRLIRGLNLGPGERLVEIGCGTGRNLIAIARAYPQARLFGLDASAAMLETASLQVRRAGLGDRITLVQGLAENFSPRDFGEDGFENALFSYSLSMIPDWRGALECAQAALTAHGRVHIVDFGDLAGFPSFPRRLMRGWLAHFHVSPRTEFLDEIEAGICPHGRFQVLPGRYAFLFCAPPNVKRD
jgi:S-adenosylmethionine-diacylgycerolhomoserine-N-methlytransferase